MLSYAHLKDHPREFLAATSLTLAEFLVLLPVFERVYETLYPLHLTVEGQTRRRRAGGGVKGGLAREEDKLWFILVYQKTHSLQTLQGLQFDLSQAQANYWIHRLLPVLQGALRELGMAPERDTERVETNPLAVAGTQEFAIDGTERRCQRPQDAVRQTAHYSGKTKAHTDKNLLLVNEPTRQVIYLSPTVAGTTHDKRAADEAQMTYPTNATLDKDTGFQGYEPIGVQTRQPKKTQGANSQRSGSVFQSTVCQCARGGRTCDRRGEAVSDRQGYLTADPGKHLGSGDGDCLWLA